MKLTIHTAPDGVTIEVPRNRFLRALAIANYVGSRFFRYVDGKWNGEAVSEPSKLESSHKTYSAITWILELISPIVLPLYLVFLVSKLALHLVLLVVYLGYLYLLVFVLAFFSVVEFQQNSSGPPVGAVGAFGESYQDFIALRYWMELTGDND